MCHACPANDWREVDFDLEANCTYYILLLEKARTSTNRTLCLALACSDMMIH